MPFSHIFAFYYVIITYHYLKQNKNEVNVWFLHLNDFSLL